MLNQYEVILEKATVQRVRQSIVSMFIARPISAVGGLLILILLSRTLSAGDYGLYFGLWAAAEILILASNLGLLHAVYRYVSAAELVDGRFVPHGPVLSLLGWRVATLCLAAAGAWLFPELLTSLAGMPPFAAGVPLMFAAIVFGEGTARFVESIFDSMLTQRRSQMTLVARTLFRLAGNLYFLADGSLTLIEVLYVEVAAALLGAILGLAILAQIYRHAGRTDLAAEGGEYRYARIVKFVLPAFIAQLLGLAYGADALKIVLTKTAGIEAVAVFGFAYSLAAVIQRYMPANLFAGVFRPVFVAASKKPDSAVLLSGLLNLTIKVNWLVVLPVFCLLFSAASPLLSKLSGGNYANSGLVLLILTGSLLPSAIHLTLSMYCLAKENSTYPLFATGLAICGLPAGVYFSKLYGAEGMALALVASEVIWAVVCWFFLQRISREPIRLDWNGLARMAGASALAIAAGVGLQRMDMVWYMVALVAALVCLLGIYFLSVFSEQEKTWLIGILPFAPRAARTS